MFAKSLLFTSLLVCSCSIFVSIKGSETHDYGSSLAIVKDLNSSDPLSTLDSDSDSDDELMLPVDREIYYIIQRTLNKLGASADELLMKIMVELMLSFDETTIKNLVTDMVTESKTNSIDRKICLNKLKEIIHKCDEKHIALAKLDQLAAIILENFPLAQDGDKPKIIDQQKTIPPKSQPKQYPLLDDVFHPDKEIFAETVEQLKTGKFSKEFSKGILLYGPPGVGKNEMVEAIIHESGCRIFTMDGSGLVSKYQGSGAGTIKLIFDQARAVEPGKGVIVLIDELQNVTPMTRDKNVQVAHTRSGQDYEDAITQLWLEYDRCMKDGNDNIMIIATCNQFERIDERIRGRFDCIEFSYPDEQGTIEILKNKSKHYGIPLSKPELEEYAARMKGLSGRDLNKFIKNAKKYTGRGKSKKEALELSVRDQKNATGNANPTKTNNRFEQFKDEVLRGSGYGVGTALGGAAVAGTLALVGWGIKTILERSGISGRQKLCQ